jgi:hypothetical protein
MLPSKPEHFCIKMRRAPLLLEDGLQLSVHLWDCGLLKCGQVIEAIARFLDKEKWPNSWHCCS